MLSHSRFTIAVAILGFLSLPVLAQDRNKGRKAEQEYQNRLLQQADEEYRQFFKKPETPQEFWAAMKFEIDVGRFGLASEFLKGLLDTTKNDDKPLLAIEEKEGLEVFLRLRLIQTWVVDPHVDKNLRKKIDAQVKANVEQLITRVTGALKKYLTDASRIAKLIKQLSGEPIDQQYAIVQLRRSGAVAVPYLIEAIRSAAKANEQATILSALTRLDKTVVPPLLAILNADPALRAEPRDLPILRVELIDVMRKRAETGVVPYLWYLAASPRQLPPVRRKARTALAEFLGVPGDKLPSAKVALTREAEKYYRHRERFFDPKAVTVWEWDGNRFVLPPPTISASRAEEYYGLRFARQALDLDPAYQPAQVVFLSLALDKGFERSGLDQPLDKAAPQVRELLRIVNPGLVNAVLDRALDDNRLPVIVGAVRALGELAEVRAARPSGKKTPPLVRALYYPERRVQLAAADALLSIPGSSAPTARIVEILRRTLLMGSSSKALIADDNQDRAEQIAKAVAKAGYDPVLVKTGREAMAHLAKAADIDIALIDHAIPYPQLPSLLAQIRADVNVGRLPVLVLVPSHGLPPDGDQRLHQLTDRYINVWIQPVTLNAQTLKNQIVTAITTAAGKPLSSEERRTDAGLAILWLKRLAVGEVPGYDVRPAADAILDSLHSEELGPLAIEAAGRLPGREAQERLAAVVLNGPPRLRPAAAYELSRHIQTHGRLLGPDEAKALEGLFSTTPDAKLKSNLARVLGSLHPNASVTGLRLQGFQPPLLAPPKGK